MPKRKMRKTAWKMALLHMQGIAKLAKRMTTHINSTRQDLRSAVISWVNFIFLPEVFNR